MADSAGAVLGQEVTLPELAITPTPNPSLTPVPSAPPTQNPFRSEVYYGTGGLYESEEYKLSLASPRLSFDARDMQSRMFEVDVTLINNKVVEGLPTQLSATIVKDGVVIVPNAAMSVSSNTIVPAGQQQAFTARLSLIEGTDVSLVHYLPAGKVSPVDHILRP
jgi:hypothetical protein